MNDSSYLHSPWNHQTPLALDTVTVSVPMILRDMPKGVSRGAPRLSYRVFLALVNAGDAPVPGICSLMANSGPWDFNSTRALPARCVQHPHAGRIFNR